MLTRPPTPIGGTVSEEGEISSVDKFEEYKLFIEDTARFSERRQKVGSTFCRR
jgi:hypothetical protein